MIKVIATDLDGTLLVPKRKFSLVDKFRQGDSRYFSTNSQNATDEAPTFRSPHLHFPDFLRIRSMERGQHPQTKG